MLYFCIIHLLESVSVGLVTLSADILHGENDDNSGDPSTKDNLDWNYWTATGIIMRAGLEFAGNCHG